MPKSNIKTVKAWATCIPNWKGGGLGDVFFYKDEALAKAKENQMYRKVIQVEITYSLPLSVKKKSK